jgi:hypothetical protein
MKKVTSLLIRSVALRFYKQHAGMFLFLFFLLFGIQPTAHEAIQTHYYLIRLILTSNYFFLFTLLVWLLYLAKGILFFKRCLQQKAYNFLYHINAIPTISRYNFLCRLALILLAPITFYGILITSAAVKDQHFSSAY